MLAEEIDFHTIFKISPTAMALLTADLEFIDANEQFLDAVGRPLAALIGRNAFDAFPKMPNDPANPKWTALEAAMTSGQRESYPLTRYDIEDPVQPGVFVERYWSSVATPIRGGDGEIQVLELSARELTPIVEQLRSIVEPV